jgi:hypothetical protein
VWQEEEETLEIPWVKFNSFSERLPGPDKKALLQIPVK